MKRQISGSIGLVLLVLICGNCHADTINLTANAYTQSIVSHDTYGTGNYGNNYTREWLIVGENSSFPILFSFQSCVIENSKGICLFDILQIYDGPDDTHTPLLSGNQKCCSPSMPGNVNPSANEVYIKFETDATVVATGFEISFILNGYPTSTITVPTAPTLAEKDNFLLYIVIACVIGGLLLLAIIIGCCIYCCKKKKKEKKQKQKIPKKLKNKSTPKPVVVTSDSSSIDEEGDRQVQQNTDSPPPSYTTVINEHNNQRQTAVVKPKVDTRKNNEPNNKGKTKAEKESKQKQIEESKTEDDGKVRNNVVITNNLSNESKNKTNKTKDKDVSKDDQKKIENKNSKSDTQQKAANVSPLKTTDKKNTKSGNDEKKLVAQNEQSSNDRQSYDEKKSKEDKNKTSKGETKTQNSQQKGSDMSPSTTTEQKQTQSNNDQKSVPSQNQATNNKNSDPPKEQPNKGEPSNDKNVAKENEKKVKENNTSKKTVTKEDQKKIEENKNPDKNITKDNKNNKHENKSSKEVTKSEESSQQNASPSKTNKANNTNKEQVNIVNNAKQVVIIQNSEEKQIEKKVTKSEDNSKPKTISKNESISDSLRQKDTSLSPPKTNEEDDNRREKAIIVASKRNEVTFQNNRSNDDKGPDKTVVKKEIKNEKRSPSQQKPFEKSPSKLINDYDNDDEQDLIKRENNATQGVPQNNSRNDDSQIPRKYETAEYKNKSENNKTSKNETDYKKTDQEKFGLKRDKQQSDEQYGNDSNMLSDNKKSVGKPKEFDTSNLNMDRQLFPMITKTNQNKSSKVESNLLYCEKPNMEIDPNDSDEDEFYYDDKTEDTNKSSEKSQTQKRADKNDNVPHEKAIMANEKLKEKNSFGRLFTEKTNDSIKTIYVDSNYPYRTPKQKSREKSFDKSQDKLEKEKTNDLFEQKMQKLYGQKLVRKQANPRPKTNYRTTRIRVQPILENEPKKEDEDKVEDHVTPSFIENKSRMDQSSPDIKSSQSSKGIPTETNERKQNIPPSKPKTLEAFERKQSSPPSKPKPVEVFESNQSSPFKQNTGNNPRKNMSVDDDNDDAEEEKNDRGDDSETLSVFTISSELSNQKPSQQSRPARPYSFQVKQYIPENRKTLSFPKLNEETYSDRLKSLAEIYHSNSKHGKNDLARSRTTLNLDNVSTFTPSIKAENPWLSPPKSYYTNNDDLKVTKATLIRRMRNLGFENDGDDDNLPDRIAKSTAFDILRTKTKLNDDDLQSSVRTALPPLRGVPKQHLPDLPLAWRPN